MKKMKFWRILLVMTVAVISLASCDTADPDGKWSPMDWEAEGPVQITDNVYNVSAAGTELTFSCQNYAYPWVAEVKLNGKYYFPPLELNDYRTITVDWFKAEISGNKLKVVFEANETAEERQIELTVTAGDCFYTFKFKQFAN